MKIPGDKIDHFLWSIGIFLGATAIFTDILDSPIRIIIGIIIASLFGVGKELYDLKKTGNFSIPDLLADSIGILVGVIIYLFLLLLLE
jgi:VanZ family protein